MQGLTEQTNRHTVSQLLAIPNTIFAVNKIDRCDYDEKVFRDIETQIQALADKVGIKEWLTIPVSALKGDQVTSRSERLSWFDGPSLLDILEGIEPAEQESQEARLSVQYVIRPHQDYRRLCWALSGWQAQSGQRLKFSLMKNRVR